MLGASVGGTMAVGTDLAGGEDPCTTVWGPPRTTVWGAPCTTVWPASSTGNGGTAPRPLTSAAAVVSPVVGRGEWRAPPLIWDTGRGARGRGLGGTETVASCVVFHDVGGTGVPAVTAAVPTERTAGAGFTLVPGSEMREDARLGRTAPSLAIDCCRIAVVRVVMALHARSSISMSPSEGSEERWSRSPRTSGDEDARRSSASTDAIVSTLTRTPAPPCDRSDLTAGGSSSVGAIG